MEIVRLKKNDIIVPGMEFHFAVHNQTSDLTLPHCHDFFEFFLITEGTIIHNINGINQVLDANTLTFIRPDDVHYYEKYKNSSCQLMNIAFNQNNINMAASYLKDALCFDSLLSQTMPPQISISIQEKESLQSRFTELNIISVEQQDLIKAKFRILLLELFYKYLANQASEKSNTAPKWLSLLYSQMQKVKIFTEGLPAMISLSGKTHEHLCREFKKYYNMTPTEYINSLRLNYASNLLANTDKGIIEISLSAGFDNLSHFYHLFKKKFGISPADYRKLNKKTVIP